jgi:hypothetical protein
MSSSEETFTRILNAKRARERQEKINTVYLGDTDRGRVISGGGFPKDRERRNPDHEGTHHVRIYRQNPGASKGRGWLGGIRK